MKAYKINLNTVLISSAIISMILVLLAGIGFAQGDSTSAVADIEDNSRIEEFGTIDGIGKQSATIDDQGFMFHADVKFFDESGSLVSKDSFSVGNYVKFIYTKDTNQLLAVIKDPGNLAETQIEGVTPEEDSIVGGEQQDDAVYIENGVWKN